MSSEVNEMNCNQLRESLKALNLSAKGSKNELRERLLKAVNPVETPEEDEGGSVSDSESERDKDTTVVPNKKNSETDINHLLLQVKEMNDKISKLTGGEANINNAHKQNTHNDDEKFISKRQFDMMMEAIRDVRTIQPSKEGSFHKCDSRFGGEDRENVEAFLDAICIYKECENVPDEKALRGIPTLVTGRAAVWWQGIKSTVHEWEQAVEAFRSAYAKTKPPYKLFQNLFSMVHNLETSTEMFVCDARAIISKFPYQINTQMQLDMVYGLINSRIRKIIPRERFQSFEDLIKLAKSVEESLDEENNPSSRSKELADKTTRMNKRYCEICSTNNHDTSVCRKRKIVEKPKMVEQSSKLPSTTVSCYGCGAPGVIRRNCSKCNDMKPVSKNPEFGLCSLNSIDPQPRPMFRIKVFEHPGRVVLDTGARNSIASHELFQILKKENVPADEVVVPVKLADGTTTKRKMYQMDVCVDLEGRIIPTTFYVFPDAVQTSTLLGIDFLKKAQVTISLTKKEWSFDDEPTIKRELLFEVSCPNLKSVNLAGVALLREDEGQMLNTEQGRILANFIQRNEDIFREGGEATPHLKKIADAMKDVREHNEQQQDRVKKYADQRRREMRAYQPGDLVLVQTHKLSQGRKGITSKLMPKRDGPYVISRARTGTTYELSEVDDPARKIGAYHTSALVPFRQSTDVDVPIPRPAAPIRKRGRPPKRLKTGPPARTPSVIQRGSL